MADPPNASYPGFQQQQQPPRPPNFTPGVPGNMLYGPPKPGQDVNQPPVMQPNGQTGHPPPLMGGGPPMPIGPTAPGQNYNGLPQPPAGQAAMSSSVNNFNGPPSGPLGYQGPRTGAGPPGIGPRPNMAMMNGPVPTQPRQPMMGPSVRTNFPPPGPNSGPQRPPGPPSGLPMAGSPPAGGPHPQMSTPPSSAQNYGQPQQMPGGSNFCNTPPKRMSPGHLYQGNIGQPPRPGGPQLGPPPTGMGPGGPQSDPPLPPTRIGQRGPPPTTFRGAGGPWPPGVSNQGGPPLPGASSQGGPLPPGGAPPTGSMGPPGGQSWAGGPLPTITAPTASDPTTQGSAIGRPNEPIGRPNELPVPYHGQGQYSHQIGDSMKLTPGLTPSNSEPASQRSSRAPSPVTSPTYDALEGQFTPNAQGHPSTGTPPPMGRSIPGQTPSDAPPTHGVGITGKRVYPSMPAQPNYAALPSDGPRPNMPPMSTAGPGSQQFRLQSGPQSGPLPGPQSGIQPGSQQSRFPQGGPPSSFQPGPPSGYQPGPQSGPPSGFQPGPQSGPPSRFQAGPQSGPPSGFQPGPQSGPPSGFQPGSQLCPPSGFQPGPQSGPGSQQPGFPMPQVGQQNTPKNFPNSMGGVNAGLDQMSIQDSSRGINLLQERQLIMPTGVETPKPNLQHDFKNVNCSPDVFRCTLTTIPQTSALLNKARLPLGILIHPFKDLSQLPVIQSSVIVRCRSCRTYINPFVYFVDTRRWKCNLCYRVNDLPDEFSFDPISKTYGEPQRRPEVRSSTIEFIAPSEYMLRPPQPAVYLFVIDVSFNAVETGYLNVFCETLLDELEKLPGDARTLVGFVAFDRAVHFFNLAEGLSQPQLLTVSDVDDIFLPSPDNLLVNIHESKDLIIDLLNQLPVLFEDNKETGNALGAALQAAYRMMNATGGRVTVMQTCLPTAGPGALGAREDPNQRTAKNVQNLGPATDFYKKLALDCSAQQIAVDLFMLNGQYSDIATLACISKYSSGSLHSYPSFQALRNPPLRDKFESDLRRYFTRKIGFEAVMRIRCTKGLSIHTFHGNFFVRSTDLLSLPNINPDAGFGMQMSIEDSLTDTSTVCFQAALLYTSSKGERRIRVHTLCLPVSNQINDVFAGADQQAIVCLVAKMAVDRSVTASLSEAREAMINSSVDALTSYGNTLTNSQRVGSLMLSFSLRLLPLYASAMMKCLAFRVGPLTKLDDRFVAMEQCKSLPLYHLMLMFYPSLYPVHSLTEENGLKVGQINVPQPPVLRLTSANLDRHGMFLMDTGERIYILVGSAISDQCCQDVFDRPNFATLEDGMNELPELENPTSEKLRNFVNYILDQRPYGVTFTVLKEDSKARGMFFQHMIEDRTDSTMSYYEFLQFLQKQVGG